jgi:hypothetical protein
MSHSPILAGVRAAPFQAAPLVRATALALVLGVAVAACGTREAPGPLQPSDATGRVRFVNLITDTARGRVNASLEGLPFGVNLTYSQSAPASLATPSTAPYAAVLAGNRSFVLKRTADTNTTVATLPFTVASGQDRSVFAVGGAGATTVTALVTTDDNTLSEGQARVRVVQLSPTAGALDVFLTAPGADLSTATPVASAVAYQGASTYLTLAPGSYQLRAVPAGTPAASRSASVSVTIATVALTAGTVRTIVTADNNVGGAPLRGFVLADR